MRKQKMAKLQSKIIALSLILFVTFAILATVQTTNAQSNNPVTTAWKLNFTLKANNGTATNSSQQATFAPFDLIQLTTTLTNGNSTAPNTTVVFNVKGPTTASYQTEIVRSTLTDNTSSANISLRIPMEINEKTVIGPWQIIANVKTSNGTLQQKTTFQVTWPIQIMSINLVNTNNQTTLMPGDTAKASLTLKSDKEQRENINLNIQDSTGNTINQTQLPNVSFNASSNNQVVYEFKVPTDTPFGIASISTGVFSGLYNGTEIFAAQNKTVYFIIGNSTTVIPTPTVTPGPTPTPLPFIENTVSLFSWVLVATGFFTFTTLFIFLKRKPTPNIGKSNPNMPSTVPNPSISTGSTEQPTPLLTGVTTAPQVLIKASSMSQTIKETIELNSQDSIATYLSNISESTKRIQDIKAILKEETNQLNKEISNLNQAIQENETVIKNYFDSIKLEVKKAQDACLSNEDINDQTIDTAEDDSKQA